jgi:hypothetical protein
MTTRLSPLAQSILQTIRHPRAGNVGEIVKRNRAALNALSIEERTAVMREVDAAAGSDLFPKTDKTLMIPLLWDIPVQTSSPRICDTISDWCRVPQFINSVRNAEKFVFQSDAFDAFKLNEELDQLVPIFAKFPYQNCWFEIEGTPKGFLIHADDSLQRGTITYVRQIDWDPIISINWDLAFDFTAGFNSNRESRSRFWPIVRQNEQECRFQLNNFLRTDGGLLQLLVMPMLLNFPKHVIEVTKDDFADYNKKRRRLGQHKKQKQELHHVKITGTKTEFTEEAARIMAERRAQYEPKGGTHAAPGEHNVRGFRRVSKYGRVTWVKPHSRGKGPCKTIRQGYKTETAVDRDIIARIVQEMADLQETA